MKTRIVVDSSANLYAMEQADFCCVPLRIVTDEREYLDDAALDAVAMAETLRTYKGKTSTSCPNVADWLSAYEGAEQLVVIPITGTLSGSFNAALLAGEEYRETHPDARIFVLDSLSLDTLFSQQSLCQPDFIEVLPGIMPPIITEISQKTQTPLIAGGLIRTKQDVLSAMNAGAAAVSTSARSVWKL